MGLSEIGYPKIRWFHWSLITFPIIMPWGQRTQLFVAIQPFSRRGTSKSAAVVWASSSLRVLMVMTMVDRSKSRRPEPRRPAKSWVVGIDLVWWGNLWFWVPKSLGNTHLLYYIIQIYSKNTRLTRPSISINGSPWNSSHCSPGCGLRNPRLSAQGSIWMAEGSIRVVADRLAWNISWALAYNSRLSENVQRKY